MPSRSIEGVKRNDGGRTCAVANLELAENARDFVCETEYEILKEQIREYGAVHDPLKCSVKPDYSGLLVHDGKQRYKIAVELGLERVPVIILKGNKLDFILVAGTGEGIKHDFVSEIRWVQMCDRAGASREQIAKAKGVKLGWVNARFALMTLSEVSRAALREGVIKLGKAKQLAKRPEDEQDAEIARIREAKAAGDTKAGKVAPKRPGVKPMRAAVETIEKMEGVDPLRIEGFKAGIQFASGEITTEQLAEQFKVEL